MNVGVVKSNVNANPSACGYAGNRLRSTGKPAAQRNSSIVRCCQPPREKTGGAMARKEVAERREARKAKHSF